MQQEDDLRGLAKVMDFMRAISILFVIIHIYWFCYGAIKVTLYIFTLTLGYILLLMAGIWMSRLLKNRLLDDVFNTENESFMQETRLLQNEYSVTLIPLFWSFNKGK